MADQFPFYLDISIRAGNIAYELFARLLTAVHHHITAGNNVAVSFPDWKGTPGDFGLVFRVFGSESELKTYLLRIAILNREELLTIGHCLPVPETDRYVVFARDRSVDKFSDANVRRLKRRAEARGELFSLKEQTYSVPHYLPMLSTTSGKPFHLFVKKYPGGKACIGGKQYGLGYVVPEF